MQYDIVLYKLALTCSTVNYSTTNFNMIFFCLFMAPRVPNYKSYVIEYHNYDMIAAATKSAQFLRFR